MNKSLNPYAFGRKPIGYIEPSKDPVIIVNNETIKFGKAGKKPELSQIQKEFKACDVMSKLSQDLEELTRICRLEIKVDIHSVESHDEFEFIVEYSSRKHSKARIVYTLSFAYVENALDDNLSTYYKMLAYFYKTILKMEV